MQNNLDILSDFEQLVQDDIRNQLPEEDGYILRSEENVYEWYEVLLGVIKKIDVQLSNDKAERARIRKEYDDRVAKKMEWRASALGFRALAEKRLHEAKSILSKKQEPVEIIKLQTAIRTHRETVEGDNPPVDAEKADQELWSIVE